MDMMERGYQGELEQLYRQHREEMCQLADSILHDPEEARDVVGEVFARIAEQKPQVEADKWQSYLLASVRNRCRDLVAHRKVEQKAIARLSREHEGTDEKSDVEEHEAVDMLRFAERELPPRTSQVFVMRFEENKSYREISHELGISIPAVYKHVLLARRKITARFVVSIALLLMVAAAVAVGARFAFHKSSVSPAEEQPVPTVKQMEDKRVQQPSVTVTFENTALADIVKQIADYHHVGVSIRNAEAAKLRLYFQWTPQDALSETLDMLNRFQRFSIVQAADGTLVVE